MKRDISIMIGNTKFNYRVGVIMEYKGKVIIEKGDKVDFGVIPGGRVMTGEDTKTALIREINEEMHFDISKKRITLCHVIENFFRMNKRNYHELYFVYELKLDDRDEIVHKKKDDFINYDSECNYYEFIDIDKLENEQIKPIVLKDIIKKRKLGRTVVRDI